MKSRVELPKSASGAGRLRIILTASCLVASAVTAVAFAAATADAAVISGGWIAPVNPMPATSAGFLANNCGFPAYGSYVTDDNGVPQYHLGIDLDTPDYPTLTPVRAIGAGTVIDRQEDWPGSAIFIRHTAADGSQFVAVYGHLRNAIPDGGTVTSGQRVGDVFDNHAHLGIRPGTSVAADHNGQMPCPGNWTTSTGPDKNGFVDPLPYLNAHPASGSTGASTVGVYRPNEARFYLRNSNTGGSADMIVHYGTSGQTPIVGDWDGNGTTTVGVYQADTRTFFLRNSNSGGNADMTFVYGEVGDVPIMGDWDGNGTTTVGVYKSGSSTFYLRNSNSGGNANIAVQYGTSGGVPIVGDWDGNGTTTVGVYRPDTRTFYLRNSNSGGNADITFAYGTAGDVPVMGDWDGNGTTTVGVYRPSSSTFYLRNSNTGGSADIVADYGASGDIPLAGDWNAA